MPSNSDYVISGKPLPKVGELLPDHHLIIVQLTKKGFTVAEKHRHSSVYRVIGAKPRAKEECETALRIITTKPRKEWAEWIQEFIPNDLADY